MKDIKIVIGANFGDEGKGLMTRYFVKDALLHDGNPIVIFHNGTAQRGHTVDYNPTTRRVYHHFSSGTGDGAPTYFAETFWVHPAQFRKEYADLAYSGVHPKVYCHPNARVITMFDMLVDHATMAWIALQNGEREHGTCGLGSWCAIESRGTEDVYSISDYMEPNSITRKQLFTNFKRDLKFFIQHVTFSTFENVYQNFDNMIFENGQGLGLDKDVNNNWHTTSSTGLTNPANMLNDKTDFNAEVCYVTRSYMTRHGIGPMDNEVQKKSINAEMYDKTNVPNEFQGSLRYGYLEDNMQKERIDTDWKLVVGNPQFTKTLAITHCNEFPEYDNTAQYLSFNPYSVMKQ